MVGSTAASLPSPHRDCPTEILDGDVVPPPPPSHAEAVVSPSLPSSIGAVVSSPSTSARAPATLPRPFLPSKNKGHASKNKGHASTEEVAAATTLCSLGPLKFLEFCLKSGLESEATRYLAKVKRTFKDLFVEYSVHEGDSNMGNDQGTNNVGTSIDNPWDQWNKHVKQHQQDRAKLSELDIYLKDDVCPQEDGFDILCWWSTNAHKYPIVSRIAKDVLAAPASSVASESAFSTGGRILSDYRSRMIETTVESLICLQDWMRPRGTNHVGTIINDVIYETHADIDAH